MCMWSWLRPIVVVVEPLLSPGAEGVSAGPSQSNSIAAPPPNCPLIHPKYHLIESRKATNRGTLEALGTARQED